MEATDINIKYFVDYSKEIGRGHNTIVRNCIERKTGERYAVKSVSKRHTKQVAELKAEAALLREIDHPHVLNMVDFYEDENQIHLVMEMCKGGELYDRVIRKANSKERRHSERDAASITRKLLEAVKYCHDKNILHRDIKLENILLKSKKANDVDIKLVDFGLATKNINHSFVTSAMTEMVGTNYYVAPEVLDCHYNMACDLWSVGIVVHALLCAKAPFVGANDAETFKLIKCGQLKFPEDDFAGVSNAAKEFVSALLRKDPISRPTASEMLNHPWIQEQLDQVPVTHTSPTTKSRMQKVKRIFGVRPIVRNKCLAARQ